jgi:hypothetical protein
MKNPLRALACLLCAVLLAASCAAPPAALSPPPGAQGKPLFLKAPGS